MHPESPSKSVFLAPDFESFKQQESIFIILNLFILVTLLLIHTVFASYWGIPSNTLIAILTFGLLAQGGELFWLLARTEPLSARGITFLSWSTITLNIVLALVLADVTNREDTQYFILMVTPILVAAFRLRLPSTLAVIGVVDFINLFWVWYYGQFHGSAAVSEYFEAGTVSLIYAIVGVMVWLLVKQLHREEAHLAASLHDLQQTRERLLQEEKLAAVGRLASAIAHEIRNPVSTIVSALSTADHEGLHASERQEMVQIAGKEAGRLEKLTTDFLAYARPRHLHKAPVCLEDALGYVADVCRPRAATRGVKIQTQVQEELRAEIDAGQLQQALVNLVMNAVEAASPGGEVALRGVALGKDRVQIDVENEGAAVPPEAVAQIFEPFFTTKPLGTGLGLAIARNIAHAHGGELNLSVNKPGCVCFSVTLPAGGSSEDNA